MTTFKKSVSIVLALLTLISMFAAIPASANYGDSEHNKKIEDCVTASSTKTLRFYMPQEWRNEYNDTYDGQDLASCSAGIYWWEGTNNCELEANKARGKGWPGYNVTETDPNCADVFVAKVPDDVTTITWNNTVYGPEKYEDDPALYQAAMQTKNTGSEYFMPGEDGYGFYPDGTDDFDGMIYVCNLNDTTINDYNGKKTYRGCWFYYYGEGKYGINKQPVEGEVFENGAWPGNDSAVHVSNGKIGECTWALDDEGVLTISGKGSMESSFSNLPWYSYADSITKVIIADGVIGICNYAFCYCTDLKSITIGKSVKSIGKKAFYGCTNLSSIEIPNSVVSIGESAFEECSSLKNVDLSSSVDAIGDNAFSNCTSLENITIPKCDSPLGQYAFSGCTNLSKIEITNGLPAIGDSAFYGCSSLKNISIPDSVENIGKEAFVDCKNLTSATIGSGCKSIDSKAFWDCPNLKKITIQYPNCIFNESQYTISTTAVICGYNNSTAYYYARTYMRLFEDIETRIRYGWIDGNFIEIGIVDEPTTEPTTEPPTYEPTEAQSTIEPTTETPTYEPTEAQSTAEPTTEPPTFEPTETQSTTEFTTESSTYEPTESQTDVESTTEPPTYEPTEAQSTTEPITETTTYNPTEAQTTVQPTTKAVIDKPTLPTQSIANNPVKPAVKIIANTIEVKAKAKTVKIKKLKFKKQTVKPLTIKKAKGRVTVTLIKKGKASKIYKKIKINRKTGAITFKKGNYVKGKYKIRLLIKASGDTIYNAKVITKKVVIRIR